MAKIDFLDKNVLVVGCDETTLFAAKLLAQMGAILTLTDLRTKSDLKAYLDELGNIPYKPEFGRYVVRTFHTSDFVIMSRKIEKEGKPFLKATQKNIPVLTDIELGTRYFEGKVVCLLGAYGKSTLGNILEKIALSSHKKPIRVGADTDSLCRVIYEKTPSDLLIIELMDKDLALLNLLTPDITILLNILDEKLNPQVDLFDTLSQYLRFMDRCLQNNGTVLANRKLKGLIDRNTSEQTCQRIQFFNSKTTDLRDGNSASSSANNFEHSSNTIQYKDSMNTSHLVRLGSNFLSQGQHIENITAVIILSVLLKLENEAIKKVLENFNGIEHRMELVREINNIYFFNNSKATNLESVINSLHCFDNKVTLIIGGKEEEHIDYTRLGDAITKKVKMLILIEDSKDRMNRLIGDFTATTIAGSFEEAVYMAYQKSRKGDIVVFSPGCVPTQRFSDSEERGRFYKHLVQQIS